MRLSKKTIEMLRATGKKHQFFMHGKRFFIRTQGGEFASLICPVCAIANDKLDKLDWFSAAHEACAAADLNISANEIDQIIMAADDPHHPYRRYLMKHLGMTND